jgi:hypothetical protein
MELKRRVLFGDTPVEAEELALEYLGVPASEIGGRTS